MKTTTVTQHETRSESKALFSDQFWKDAEFNRHFLISMFLIAIGCIGGFAAGFAIDNVLQLALVAFPTAITLASILSVMPMRFIMGVTTITILLDLGVIIANL